MQIAALAQGKPAHGFGFDFGQFQHEVGLVGISDGAVDGCHGGQAVFGQVHDLGVVYRWWIKHCNESVQLACFMEVQAHA